MPCAKRTVVQRCAQGALSRLWSRPRQPRLKLRCAVGLLCNAKHQGLQRGGVLAAALFGSLSVLGAPDDADFAAGLLCSILGRLFVRGQCSLRQRILQLKPLHPGKLPWDRGRRRIPPVFSRLAAIRAQKQSGQHGKVVLQIKMHRKATGRIRMGLLPAKFNQLFSRPVRIRVFHSASVLYPAPDKIPIQQNARQHNKRGRQHDK